MLLRDVRPREALFKAIQSIVMKYSSYEVINTLVKVLLNYLLV